MVVEAMILLAAARFVLAILPFTRGMKYLGLSPLFNDAASARRDVRPQQLAWRLSNTMDVEFCVEALEDAMARHGRPEIFNTDQGDRFTSPRFTKVLTDAGIRVSMDGRGRSLKYECVYLNAFETGGEAGAGIGRWIEYYNAVRPHSAFGGGTPLEIHERTPAGLSVAARDRHEPSLEPPKNCPPDGDHLKREGRDNGGGRDR